MGTIIINFIKTKAGLHSCLALQDIDREGTVVVRIKNHGS